jgi:CubicO group peptidase (beta-lactamase class C family)
MTADRYQPVSNLITRLLADGFPPAIVLAVSASRRTLYSAAGGWAKLGRTGGQDTDGHGGSPDVNGDPVPADADTLFDLASLTKVVATLPLVLLLHQRHLWSIDDPVHRWLPGAPRSPVTISDLLLHIGGLVPHREYYASYDDPVQIRRAVIAELADAVPGQVSYSDLGFMLLGWAVQECAEEPFAELVSREVLGPLGMTSTGFAPRARLERIAATEMNGDQRPGAGLVWGRVHDGNAFALGGVSGHAGLFGPAADLVRFCRALLTPDRHPVLSAQTIALITARHAGTGAEQRALGWRLCPQDWGDWPEGTLWHTGFTGTSLLIAPPLDAAVVLLTNAVHPVRRQPDTAVMRADVHRLVRAAVETRRR